MRTTNLMREIWFYRPAHERASSIKRMDVMNSPKSLRMRKRLKRGARWHCAERRLWLTSKPFLKGSSASLSRYIMCSSSDLSTECANPHEKRSFPERLLVYDKHPGGIGITTQIQLLFRELLIAASELVSTCSCLTAAGCPNCIQAMLCSEYNEVLNKKAAVTTLKGVIESENAYFKCNREAF